MATEITDFHTNTHNVNSIHLHQTSTVTTNHHPKKEMHIPRLTIPIPLPPHLRRLKPNRPNKTARVLAQFPFSNSSSTGVRTSLHAVSAQLPLTKTDYSISDAELESRGFHLRRTPDGLSVAHLNSVFVSVGFPKRDPDKIRTALDHTDCLFWIEYEKTKRPVAFARATGDGVFNAIIWDVVVDPSFQGIGLGKAVMERVVNGLLEKGIRNIALYSEPRVLGFYRPLGFVADPGGIKGMVYSRKQKKKKL